MLDSETTERITEGSKNLEQHMKIYDCVWEVLNTLITLRKLVKGSKIKRLKN